MNDNLTKLADQCRTLYRDGNGQYIEQFDEEKFAELIVLTCIAKCADLDSMKYIADHFDIKFDFDWMNDDQRI